MAQPALAQGDPAPPADESDTTIVVTGDSQPPTRREVFEQALDVSRVDPGRMYEETLARFTAPLCPAVNGLRGDMAGEMVARIRTNAEELGVKLGREGCRANLVIAFADDGRSLVGDLQRRHPQLFGLLGDEERDELLTERAPARVWNVVETKWANGAPLPYRRGRVQLPSDGQVNRLLLSTRKDIDFTLVVFDRESCLGMSVLQLADYATMRGLAYTRPATGDGPMMTILSLFEDGGREIDGLTDFDIGYLRSVYYWKPEYAVPAVGRLLSVRRRAEAAAEEAP